MDLSNSYRTVFDTMLPDAMRSPTAFRVVRVANTASTSAAPRVQHETFGYDGRKHNHLPLPAAVHHGRRTSHPTHGRERLR